MGFMDDYEPVETRLARFWQEHPQGRVRTVLISNEDGFVVFTADLWRDIEDPQPAATGWAQEQVTDRGVNSTSSLENCETSALGRALANAGYAPKGKRPSREEMSKGRAVSGSPPPAPAPPSEKQRVADAVAAAFPAWTQQMVKDACKQHWKAGMTPEATVEAVKGDSK